MTNGEQGDRAAGARAQRERSSPRQDQRHLLFMIVCTDEAFGGKQRTWRGCLRRLVRRDVTPEAEDQPALSTTALSSRQTSAAPLTGRVNQTSAGARPLARIVIPWRSLPAWPTSSPTLAAWRSRSRNRTRKCPGRSPRSPRLGLPQGLTSLLHTSGMSLQGYWSRVTMNIRWPKLRSQRSCGSCLYARAVDSTVVYLKAPLMSA